MYYVKFRVDSKDSLLRALMDLTRLENLKGSKFIKKLSAQNMYQCYDPNHNFGHRWLSAVQ